MYYKNINEAIGLVNIVNILDSGEVFWIPIDILNKDYVEYLSWVESGNEPLEFEDSVINPEEV
jgi:hypothetical protein